MELALTAAISLFVGAGIGWFLCWRLKLRGGVFIKEATMHLAVADPKAFFRLVSASIDAWIRDFQEEK